MIPFRYSYRNLLVRWKTTLMTAGGFTLVVAALVVMIAFVNGIRTVCQDSGDSRNVVVLAKGNTDEVLSRIDMPTARYVETTPGVIRRQRGRPLLSRELFLVITQPDPHKAGQFQMLQARGVLPEAFEVHTQVQVTEGRMFQAGSQEVVVGRRMQQEHGMTIGSQHEIGRRSWKVVGIFDANNSLFESEVWCPIDSLADTFRRPGSYTSLVARTRDSNEAQELAARLSATRMITVEAVTEPTHYANQAEQTDLLYTAGMVIAAFMSLGAVFGITNTMFAAIGQRIKDIAVMRLLGFRKSQILTVFLIEALLIAALGGAVGLSLGYSINGLTQTFALGARSVAFAFHVDAGVLALGVAFTMGMGLIGGLLPAWSAMRVEALESLR